MHSAVRDSTTRVPLSLFVAGLCIALTGCTGSGPAQTDATAVAEPEVATDGDHERDVIAAHKALIAAMEAGDIAAMTALMDPAPELLIFHPFIEDRFDGIGEIDEGLGRMFGALGSVTWTEVHPTISIEGDVAWLTAQILVKSAAFPSPFVGRGTEIWVRGPEGWRLNHAHWSEHARLAGTVTDD